MIEYDSLACWQSPTSTIRLLEHCWEQIELYNDHVEVLRRLLTFIEDKAGETGLPTGLWTIKKKQEKKLNKLLQSLDDLLVEIKEDNR